MRRFDADAMWEEAKRLGLILPEVRHYKDLKDRFGFDCNTLGCFQTSKQPGKILELVLLIREKYATSKTTGEHHELLAQSTFHTELSNSYSRWGRRYHIGGDISLREWLAEQGHPYPYDE